MNIKITTEAKDAALLESFAAATGWNEGTGKTLEEWVQRKVGEYVTREARNGYVRSASASARETFVRAIQESTLAAKSSIQPPVVTAALSPL